MPDLIEASDPWWLAWVIPVVAIITATGGALIWLGRMLLLPGIKKELEELLKDRFEEAAKGVRERHAENQEDFRRIDKRMEEGARERKDMRRDLNGVLNDVSYLRGKSGTNTPPRGK